MSMDKSLYNKYRYRKHKECEKGHWNSPSAKICWKCGSKNLKVTEGVGALPWRH